MQYTTAPCPTQGIIDSDTVILQDRWLHRWRGDPPRDFCLYKVLFKPRTPLDIVAQGYQVLTPAVTELAAGLDIANTATKLDWLKLDTVRSNACLVGTYAEQTVVAASDYSSQRRPFIPYRFYNILAESKQWKNLSCYSSYRHFLVRFDTGLTFYTDRNHKLCDVEYVLHFGVHGVHSLWSMIRIDDSVIAVPKRFRVSETLEDLPGKVQQVTRFGQHFIGTLGASWLRERDQEQLWSAAMQVLKPLQVPRYHLQDLKNDPKLMACLTRLDILLFLCRIFQEDSTIASSNLLQLSKSIFSQSYKIHV